MTVFLWNSMFFLLSIAVLVAVHEFGHFWIARKLGVPVLRFSIGFGPALWRRTGRDGCEYVFAAIPLGGYVKLLDEREDRVPAERVHQAFNRQPVWVRVAVVAAGPVFNFLLAILAFVLMFMIGVQDVRPVLGDIKAGSAAEKAGLVSGMRLVEVAGTPVQTWEQVGRALLSHLGKAEALPVTVIAQSKTEAEAHEQSLWLPAGSMQLDSSSPDFLGQIGISPAPLHVPAVIGEVLAGQAAERAGLRAADSIHAVNGVKVKDWRGFASALKEQADKAVTLSLRRGGQPLTVTVVPRREVAADGSSRGVIGVAPATPEDLVTVRYNPWQALIAGVVETGDTVHLMLKAIWQLLSGAVSVKALSGPLAMAEGAGATAQLGIERFLQFLGFLSVNLGLVNLLPIPVLDGGHLFFYLLEGIRGRPLPERIQEIGMRLGLSLVGTLMLIALYNDFARLM